MEFVDVRHDDTLPESDALRVIIAVADIDDVGHDDIETVRLVVKLTVGDAELVADGELVAEAARLKVDDLDGVDVWHMDIEGDIVWLDKPLWLPETVAVADPLRDDEWQDDILGVIVELSVDEEHSDPLRLAEGLWEADTVELENGDGDSDKEVLLDAVLASE